MVIQLSDLAQLVQKQVETYTKQGYGNLPQVRGCHVQIHSGAHGIGQFVWQDPVLVLSRLQVEMCSGW